MKIVKTILIALGIFWMISGTIGLLFGAPTGILTAVMGFGVYCWGRSLSKGSNRGADA